MMGCTTAPAAPPVDWRVAGGDPGNTRYSTLDQINTANVAQLRVAWVYHTGDMPAHGPWGGPSEIQATPIVVGGVLYTTTPALAVVALRADRGKLIWRFDPRTAHPGPRTDLSHVNRGVVYWADGADSGFCSPAAPLRPGRPHRPSDRHIRRFRSIDLAAGLSRDIGDAYVIATSPRYLRTS
jgi:quinoprotein glucose dehydrogenase